MKRIAVMTSGGDAPGMNAAIRAVVRAALAQGIEVHGIRRGYEGLLNEDLFAMNSQSVGGIINLGGTILRSARSKRFQTSEGLAQAAEILTTHEIQGLVVIGGDGSMKGACALNAQCGAMVMGIPGTIDNDIPGTDYSIGFDTAINTALDAIDKVRDTAYSHERVFIIEVMGRHNGFIALEAGLAGGAEAILIPEIPYDLQAIIEQLDEGYQRGKRSCIIVVAEGATRAADLQKYLEENSEYQARALTLGHMQRGGSPTAFDRVLATRLGAHAITRLKAGFTNEMVGVEGDRLVANPIDYVVQAQKHIDSQKLALTALMAI
ncbi:MAG: 6-phosphofructokinase [Fimbriimonadia bacterium]|nr:6-phosphofructokinase [Fimbriimonadia bacterium]